MNNSLPLGQSQRQNPVTDSGVLTCYPQIPYAYDEAFDHERLTRSHWKLVFDSLTNIGAEGIRDRQMRAQRILRDDGATYDLKSDPLSPTVWSLDIIPYVIDHQEWLQLEAGIEQRSKLFDLILKDLYGEQNLLKQGIIPAEIIFSHPGYLRQCHHLSMPLDKQLILHAVDLVRDQNGAPVIIGDRTQAPSGFGYALENRTVVSRVMPSLFRTSQVRRLSHFFNTLRTTLAQLASHKTDTPRIVVLSPGAYSSTYFEHEFLANYLGYSLVQGGDLTVRNGKVWMKSLQGLTQVDVILRRVDDTYCDQAELRADSMLGVPGLLEVVRAGNVVLANPLGSGIIEAPALMAFLPQISQFLLGEPLLLNNVQTWWCGNATDFAYVQANLDDLIIKPAYRSFNSSSYYGHALNDQEKRKLIKKIAQKPHQYVAQSYIPGSQTPIWTDGKLESRPSLLRLFSVSCDDGYEVMPGGLSRVAASNQEYIVSKLSGTWSKDAWVLSNGPDLTHHSLLDKVPIGEAEQSNLPSRVVENLFWFGRYAERAEISLRLMRTVFKQLNGIDPLPVESRDVLLKALSKQTGCMPGFTAKDTELLEKPNQELADLVVNGNRIGSIKSNLQSMLACGEQVKEMLSADTRIILNELRDHIYDVDRAYVNGLPAVPEESLDSLVTSLLALSGLNHESMLRGLDWTFQEIGRRTERALQTATLLKSTLTQELPNMQQQQVLESVLLSVEALISFRRRYRTRARVAFGLDLLMVDPTNPRSLVYQIEQLSDYLKVLPQQTHGFTPGRLSPESKLMIKALNIIQLADLDELARVEDVEGSRIELTKLMVDVTKLLEQFTSAISDKYFDHTAGPQQLIKPKWKLDV